MIFQAVKSHSRNCVFTETVYDVTKPSNNESKSRFTALAKPTGSCEIILLNLKKIKEWWTSATDKRVAVFTENNNLLFEFNKHNAHMWDQLKVDVDTHFYKVIIPTNASLILDIPKNDNETNNYSHLLSSMGYGACLSKPSYAKKYFSTNENSSSIFKILDLKMSESASFFLGEQKVTHVGQSFNFEKNEIELNYKNNKSDCFEYLLRIDIVPNQ